MSSSLVELLAAFQETEFCLKFFDNYQQQPAPNTVDHKAAHIGNGVRNADIAAADDGQVISNRSTYWVKCDIHRAVRTSVAVLQVCQQHKGGCRFQYKKSDTGAAVAASKHI